MPEEPPARRPLPEGYYLKNFETVLATVAERYDDLLRSEEVAFLDAFADLSTAARRLYVRLIVRRGPIFRRDRLSCCPCFCAPSSPRRGSSWPRNPPRRRRAKTG